MSSASATITKSDLEDSGLPFSRLGYITAPLEVRSDAGSITTAPFGYHFRGRSGQARRLTRGIFDPERQIMVTTTGEAWADLKAYSEGPTVEETITEYTTYLDGCVDVGEYPDTGYDEGTDY